MLPPGPQKTFKTLPSLDAARPQPPALLTSPVLCAAGPSGRFLCLEWLFSTGGAADLEQGPGMLLSILQRTGQPFITTNYLAPNSNSAEAETLPQNHRPFLLLFLEISM